MLKLKNWVSVGSLEALKQDKTKVIKGGIAVFYHEDQVYAVDNRCPHLGFPLHLGSLCDGILTCHWHHARFDVCSGGTLDPWADDVPAHDVIVENGEVWVNPVAKTVRDVETHKQRLKEGLEQNIGIVIAKAVVALVEAGVPDEEITKVGIEFGTTYGNGWHSGLTILTAMARILPKLDKQGRVLALYQGLSHVARNSSGRAERHLLGPLPAAGVSFERLTDWYRHCCEVRDTQGAEKVLLTAVQAGVSADQLAEMMMLAVTDHFFLDGGHTLDFHNKAFESLEFMAEDQQGRVISSLVPLMGNPSRSEEQHRWQSPVNLVQPLKEAFARLETGMGQSDVAGYALDEEKLLDALLGDDPLATVQLLEEVLMAGASPARVAQIAALAAAERIVRFHTQNEFGDWIVVLHTFTYAHAVHQQLQRSSHPLLTRAIFHGAMSVYHDRFLNVPAASRPKVADISEGDYVPNELLDILDQRQQVNEAARWVTGYMRSKGDVGALMNALGHVLLREDADFHTFQMLEAAIVEYDKWNERNDAFAERAKETMLLAATRYVAVHAPTARELPHTARIAWRLHRGEKLFEEA